MAHGEHQRVDEAHDDQVVARLRHRDGKRHDPARPALLEQVALAHIGRLPGAIRLGRRQGQHGPGGDAIAELEGEGDLCRLRDSNDEQLRAGERALEVLVALEDAAGDLAVRSRDVVVTWVQAIPRSHPTRDPARDEKDRGRESGADGSTHGPFTVEEKVPSRV